MTPKIFKLSSIKPHKDNPRLIRDENFEKLKKSIIDFPKMLELRPIIVDENNVILGGNMRYKALKELGYKSHHKQHKHDLQTLNLPVLINMQNLQARKIQCLNINMIFLA